MDSQNFFNFDELRNLTIGVVEAVAPNQIEVALEINAPQNTAINTGIPTQFPKINGYVLIPNEMGAVVGQITNIYTKYSNYPKRRGYKDFDLIDLPFPLRKMVISPLGILKSNRKGKYSIDRGVYSYPSVGDNVVIPSNEQLKSIVENRDENAIIKIGTCPTAGNAEIRIDPDKLFGRHLAVLGNTGSGKSCSVAGIIRWTLEQAQAQTNKNLNSRFIILDPNGEYSKTFDDLPVGVKKLKVSFSEDDINSLNIPAWLWNSYEWSAITQASSKTQRPILRQALRELKAGKSATAVNDDDLLLRRYMSGLLVYLNKAKNWLEYKTDATKFGYFLKSIHADCVSKQDVLPNYKDDFISIHTKIRSILEVRYDSFQKAEKTIKYYKPFCESEVGEIIEIITAFVEKLGGLIPVDGPNEDDPIKFQLEDLPNYIEYIAQEQKAEQFLDFLVMRIRTLLSDTRMNTIISEDGAESLEEWLKDYLGEEDDKNCMTIIDLSLIPTEIVHLSVAVITRIIFEAIQRYRRVNDGKVLPTNIVLEEAHTFVKRYSDSGDEINAQKMCTQTYERIAREGRKFGLGLLLSSQRPSELSPTVLSQCNTFLLHRIVNDEDQRLVKKLVPDNLGGLMEELPILPSRKAILVGWAAPLPVMVEMNYLKDIQRPQSNDPDFWNVWTRKVERPVDWSKVSNDWLGEGKKVDDKKKDEEEIGIE